MDVEGLYMRYGPMVLRRCRRLLRDENAAQDALQDVFLKLMGVSSLTAQYPSSLLYTMATNVCLDRLRSARARYEGGMGQEIAMSENIEERAWARRMLDRIFRRQDHTRTIAVLHLVDGL